MNRADGFVIQFTEQTVVQMMLHIISILMLIGTIAVMIYVLVLLIKLARRGIVALDIWIALHKNEERNEELE